MPRTLGIVDPVGEGLGQLLGARARIVLTVILVSDRKRPVDVGEGARATVDAKDRATPLVGVEVEHLLGLLDERDKGHLELVGCVIELLTDDLFVMRGDTAS